MKRLVLLFSLLLFFCFFTAIVRAEDTKGTLNVYASYNGLPIAVLVGISGPETASGATHTDGTALLFSLTPGIYMITGTYTPSGSPIVRTDTKTVSIEEIAESRLNFGGQLPNQTSIVTMTEFNIEPVAYRPCKITFNYPYTHSASIINITSVAQSQYNHTGGPTFTEFITNEIDDYSFTMIVRYENESVTERTVLVGLFSGSLPAQGFAVSGSTVEFQIHVRLRVMEEPRYPDKVEIAQEMTRQIEQKLVTVQEEARNLAKDSRDAMTLGSISSSISMVLSIVALVLVALLFRGRKAG